MKYIVAFFTAACVVSCNNSKTTETEKPKEEKPITQQELVFDKIVGTWRSEDGNSFERWTKDTGDYANYTTAGFTVKGSDTSWNEKGKVYLAVDNWYFANTVNGQNEGKAVTFAVKMMTDQSVQFSNPDHDFPTDINYTVVNGSTLRAFIVGPNDKGGKDTIPFNFTRVK